VLQDTLFALQSLPPGLLFDTNKRSSVWVDIVNKTTRFLVGVVTNSNNMKCLPPCTDRQLGVAILMELAVQQADFAAFLDVAAVCLKVSGDLYYLSRLTDCFMIVLFIMLLKLF